MVDVRERLLAEPLHGVRVKQNSTFTAKFAELSDGLDGAVFIIHRLDGNQNGVGTQSPFEFIDSDKTMLIYRQFGDLETLFLPKIFTGVEHGMMFHTAGNNVPTFAPEQPRGAEYGEVVTFGPSAREGDFAGLAGPGFRDAVAGVVEQSPSAAANVMDAGRVPENIAQKRKHGLSHLRIERRGGVVVEVNGPHEIIVGSVKGKILSNLA